MKLTKFEGCRAGKLTMLCMMAAGTLGMTPVRMAIAQGLSTTTVQGTVYLANGQAGAGTLVLSWPAFTTAAGLAVAADSTTVTIPADGFLSVNLAPNVGALPAGEYYTAMFYMRDGTVSTQYWQVPAGAQASLAQVQTRVMPAAQAVQAVSKSYVDQSITELTQSLLTASGGTLSGPLLLNSDPTQALQAADKHYVDTQVSSAVPLAGGNMTGALGTPTVNGVEAPVAGSAQTTLQQAMNAAGTNGAMQIPPTYAGTDTFTNANGVKVTDLRTSGAQQTERSVKEFGAVCDGVSDDTNALQAALNYANVHGVALTIPEGTCKTRSLNWHGESIGGMGKQVSALMGFPGQDVLASMSDSPNLLQYTRLHDLTIYVDQSVDVSCSAAEGRAAAGSCQVSRLLEKNSIFSPGGNGLTGVVGSGAAWAVGNCAIAMPAATGTGGNGLRVAEIENLEIATTGVDPMAAQYPGAHSTHTCGMYLAQWPQWSEFRNIDIRGVNTGVAIPALPVTAPAGLTADSNRWQNITIQATHAFTAAAGCNGVLDTLEARVSNSSATSEPPTGLVLDLPTGMQGWTVRNAVVVPTWNAVPPALTVTAAGGAVTAVTLGTEHGLGWDPYGTSVPLTFSGSCTAHATAAVNSNGSIGSVNVMQGGVGCSSTTTASVNETGTWDTAAPVNLVSGSSMTFFAGNLVKGNGGYTVWNASGAQSFGTQLSGGGGNLPGGGSYPALVATSSMGSTLQADQFPGADFGAKLQACLGAVNASYGGTCDARNFTGNLSMASNLTISTGNTTVLLPCATITTANQLIVTAGTRNVALRGCALRGGSAANGSQGGTAFAYSGAGAMVQVGDPTYAVDTPGFHMDNVVINTTAATSASSMGLAAYRTQEMDLESLYLLGNGNQTGMTLDGTGNYTGGTFLDDQFGGFQTAVSAVGHQVTNPATTDWMNASAFVRLHIDCPTSGGSPISGTTGINLQQGDGNTFTGGDVEGCSTALHLGANAQNNTLVGLRNENSTNQVVADAGSSYNNWMTGGTMFTGQLTDNGTRNSFLDTFHRSFNGLNGDWYGSQQDATVINHFRLGTGAGSERGLLNEVQTDYGYRWLEGYSDATSGEQLYQVEDLLNNVNRLSIGQYNHGQSSTNNQTVINAAGTGAIVLNGSNNAGTGGVAIGSGGTSAATVATISNAGNAQFNGTLQVGSTAQSTGTMTVRNNADAEVDYYLWPGLTAAQKGSFTYKDWNGNSQWYLVKDQSNNWAVNSALNGLDSFKAYQSTNSGDTYVNASNSTGHIRLNYETNAGAETDIYSGGSSNLVAAFLGTTSIKFPGLAAGSGHYCLQVDNSGYLTNTGSACGTGSGSGTVGSGNAGQIAYYTGNGAAVGGMSMIPMTAGGTGSSTAAGALANLGGQAALPGLTGDGASGVSVTGAVAAGTVSSQNINGNLALIPGTVLQTLISNAEAAGTHIVDIPPGKYAILSRLQVGSTDGKYPVTLRANGNVILDMLVADGGPGILLCNGSSLWSPVKEPRRNLYAEIAAGRGGPFLIYADSNSNMDYVVTNCDQTGAANTVNQIDGVQFRTAATMVHPPRAIVQFSGLNQPGKISDSMVTYFDNIGIWLTPPGEMAWLPSTAEWVGATINALVGSTLGFYEATAVSGIAQTCSTAPTFPTPGSSGSVTDCGVTWTDVTNGGTTTTGAVPAMGASRLASVYHLDNDVIAGRSGTATANPLVLSSQLPEGGLASIHCQHCNFENVGAGISSITGAPIALVDILGSGQPTGSGVLNVVFDGETHMEGGGTLPDQIGFYIAGASNISVENVDATDQTGGGGILFDLVTPAGLWEQVNLKNITAAQWPTVISDAANGNTLANINGTCPTGCYSLWPAYNMSATPTGATYNYTDPSNIFHGQVVTPGSVGPVVNPNAPQQITNGNLASCTSSLPTGWSSFMGGNTVIFGCVANSYESIDVIGDAPSPSSTGIAQTATVSLIQGQTYFFTINGYNDGGTMGIEARLTNSGSTVTYCDSGMIALTATPTTTIFQCVASATTTGAILKLFTMSSPGVTGTVYIAPTLGLQQQYGNYNPSGYGPGPFYGNLAGNVTGNVTGSLAGNVTGNVTGNVSGNASGLSGTPNLPTGTTINATPSTSDNSTKVQTTAGALAQIAANALSIASPAATGTTSIASGKTTWGSGGGLTYFDGVATDGNMGQCIVVATVAPNTYTAAVSSTTLIASTPAAGMYRISEFIGIAVAGTSTIQGYVGFTSDGNTGSRPVTGAVSSTTQGNASVGLTAQGMYFYADSGTAIKYAIEGPSFTGTYRFAATLERCY